MQTIEWKRKPLGSTVANTIAANLSGSFSPRCPECWNALREKPIEIIADFAGWHLGWRQYTCAHCQRFGTRIVLTRNTRQLQYQTHPVCQELADS